MRQSISSAALIASVLGCALLLVTLQLLVLRQNSQNLVANSAQPIALEHIQALLPYFPQDKPIQLCQHLADGRSLAADTTCLVKPTEKIQSFSSLKVWSYQSQSWINPPLQFKDNNRTLIHANVDPTDLTAPTIITCPWGCTLGYP